MSDLDQNLANYVTDDIHFFKGSIHIGDPKRVVREVEIPIDANWQAMAIYTVINQIAKYGNNTDENIEMIGGIKRGEQYLELDEIGRLVNEGADITDCIKYGDQFMGGVMIKYKGQTFSVTPHRQKPGIVVLKGGDLTQEYNLLNELGSEIAKDAHRKYLEGRW